MTDLHVSNAFKRGAIITHDLVMTALAFVGCLALRFHLHALGFYLPQLLELGVLFVAVAGIVYRLFPLYASKWRFASLPDLFIILQASTVLAVALLAITRAASAWDLLPDTLFIDKTVLVYWLLQLFGLGGPRLAYRYFKFVQPRRLGERENLQSVVVVGRAAEAEIVLRALETGLRQRFIARAILSPSSADQRSSIRNVPILGGFDDLERVALEALDRDQPITRLIVAPENFGPEAGSERLVATAARLGIALSRMHTSEGAAAATAAALKPLAIEDLLFRDTVDVDRAALAGFIRGKRAIVTGGGGSIGSELCRRLVALGASELLILDISETALFDIREALDTGEGATRIHSAIADVRDRDRITGLFMEFGPDLVFHAAALKQVPFLEVDWTEGIKTNVFGSVNVADAAAATARAAVLISTDKAVNPVSILGATKRFSEIYAQLLDEEALAAGAARRIASVRFGNVLGSVGSVVPRFKAQIERGGPVTVTHPDMVRYFMTIREACELVITASRHAAAPRESETERASVYVLKMGQPAKIVDLAERMIRLAGYEPGRDMAIAITGIRKGERLNEFLFADQEPVVDIGVAGVTAARTSAVGRATMTAWLDGLRAAIERDDRAAALRVFHEAIPTFKPGGPAKMPASEAPSSAASIGA